MVQICIPRQRIAWRLGLLVLAALARTAAAKAPKFEAVPLTQEEVDKKLSVQVRRGTGAGVMDSVPAIWSTIAGGQCPSHLEHYSGCCNFSAI